MQDLMQVFREALIGERGRRGLTTEELSAFLGEKLGLPLHATAITKLEKGARGVSLQEAVALALALGVPLPLMLVPTGEEPRYRITPGHEMTPGRALNWMLRGEPALDSGITWQTPNMWPIAAFHSAAEANQAARDDGAIAWNLERSGQDATSARHRYHLRLVKLRQAIDTLAQCGLASVAEGWWPDAFAADLATLDAEMEGGPADALYGGFVRRSDDPEDDR